MTMNFINLGRSITLNTLARYKDTFHHWLDVQGQSNIRFKVSTCNIARILLCQFRDVIAYSTYEVVLSANINSNSVIKDALNGKIVVNDLCLVPANICYFYLI